MKVSSGKLEPVVVAGSLKVESRDGLCKTVDHRHQYLLDMSEATYGCNTLSSSLTIRKGR